MQRKTCTGTALAATIRALTEVIGSDQNVFCVGYAMDALTRLANLRPRGEEVSPPIADLQANLVATLRQAPIRGWEALVRGGLSASTVAEVEGAPR